jgi:hypothetical protein
MFVGHYGVSYAAKRVEGAIPLWVLFLAVQLVDVAWAVFVLLGIEKVRIVPGFTATNPLDLYYMPYTHGLVASVLWSVVAALAYRLLARRPGSLLVGLAVFSHWVLDFLVHVPDLPLWDDTAKVGLGLWNRPALAFGLEGVIVIGGLALFLRRRPARTVAQIVFVLLMLAVQASVFFSPPPGSGAQIALTALASYAVFALVAWWLVDRRAGPAAAVE